MLEIFCKFLLFYFRYVFLFKKLRIMREGENSRKVIEMVEERRIDEERESRGSSYS